MITGLRNTAAVPDQSRDVERLRQVVAIKADAHVPGLVNRGGRWFIVGNDGAVLSSTSDALSDPGGYFQKLLG
jgi:hypothetical protein